MAFEVHKAGKVASKHGTHAEASAAAVALAEAGERRIQIVVTPDTDYAPGEKTAKPGTKTVRVGRATDTNEARS